jgi:predicted nucleotidyltransferase
MLLKILAQHVPDAEVWAYGSRVNGGAHEGSDLDLVVRSPDQLHAPQKNLHLLRDALTESNLPMLVEVLDWARIPETFRREIERQHVVVVSAEHIAAK